MSLTDLWVDYVAVGGARSIAELTSILNGETELDSHDYDLIALALNERFAESGLGRPIDYSHQYDDEG